MTTQQAGSFEGEIESIRALNIDQLRTRWRTALGSAPPEAFTKDLLARGIIQQLQEQAFGGLDRTTAKLLASLVRGKTPAEGQRRLKVGTVVVREYQGERHTVTIVPDGFVWRETVYPSLTTIARAITGTAWNGPRFFGLRTADAETNSTEGQPANGVSKVKRSRSSPDASPDRVREARQ